MTNQLIDTDPDPTATRAPAPSPVRTIPGATGERPERSGGKRRRWMLLGSGLALAATAVFGIAIGLDDRSDTRDPVDPATDRPSASSTVRQPAYLIIQNEIDAALAERTGSVDDGRSTAQLIEDQIGAALAANSGTSAD